MICFIKTRSKSESKLRKQTTNQSRPSAAVVAGPFTSKHNATRPTLGKDIYLDGGPGEAAQLLDVLSFLSDDGPDGLRWDVHVDRLLLRSLGAQTSTTGAYVHTTSKDLRCFGVFFFTPTIFSLSQGRTFRRRPGSDLPQSNRRGRKRLRFQAEVEACWRRRGRDPERSG